MSRWPRQSCLSRSDAVSGAQRRATRSTGASPGGRFRSGSMSRSRASWSTSCSINRPGCCKLRPAGRIGHQSRLYWANLLASRRASEGLNMRHSLRPFRSLLVAVLATLFFAATTVWRQLRSLVRAASSRMPRVNRLRARRSGPRIPMRRSARLRRPRTTRAGLPSSAWQGANGRSRLKRLAFSPNSSS